MKKVYQLIDSDGELIKKFKFSEDDLQRVIEKIEDIEEQQEHEIDNGEYDNEEEKEYERLLRGRR